MNYFRCGGGRSSHLASQITLAKTPLATFQSNVSGLYIPEIIVYIQATQSGSGTPSPTNPRSIVGADSVSVTRTGKNIWSYGDVSGTRRKAVTVDIKAGTYTLSANVTSSDTDYNNNRIVFYYEDETTENFYINRGTRENVTFTLLKNVNSIYFYASRSYDASADDTFSFTDIQLEAGSTATPYEAYTGTTATTALPTTCYGGYLNVETGVLTRDCAIVTDLSQLSWTYQSTYGRFVSTDLASTIKAPPNNSTAVENAMCSIYTIDKSNNTSSSSYDKIIAVSSAGNLQIRDTELNGDLTALSTRLANAQFKYPLATPTTEQLTPHQIEQLLGQNNVFCSSGDVAVKGWKID